MRKFFTIAMMLLALIVPLAAAQVAGAVTLPDQFQGDTAIYGGASTHIMPNVLLIIDNSNATLNMASGQSYDNTHNYYDECKAANTASNCYKTFGIYYANQKGDYHTNQLIVDNTGGLLNTATTQGVQTEGMLPNLQCQNPGKIGTALLSGGSYQGSATSDNPNLQLKQSTGMGICDTSGQGQAYALGNFLNYTLVPAPPYLVKGSDGNNYQLTVSHMSGGSDCPDNPDDRPGVGTQWSTYWSLYTGTTDTGTTPTPPQWQECTPYDLGSNPEQKLIFDALTSVVGGARFAAKFGAMVYGKNNSGGNLIYPIKDISANTDFGAFMSALPGANNGAHVLSSETARPQSEALYDAYQYFLGKPKGTFDYQDGFSPVFTSRYCEELFVILLTNGLPNKEDSNALCNKVGDYDKDGKYNEAPPCSNSSGQYGLGTHYLDDMADMMYSAGVSTTDSEGNPYIQRITTNVVAAFFNGDPLLQSAASEGNGSYFVVGDAATLAAALGKILASIMLRVDTSFVAPVVPVSPENKVYTGNRVYMGFFKPQLGQYWYGNLKKYGLDAKSNIIDMNDNFANYVDQNFDGKDDRDGVLLPDKAQNGSFRASPTDPTDPKKTAQSFWSTAPDGGAVDKGGAGEVLQNRNFSVLCPTCDIGGDVRKIYTYLGTNTNLADQSNAFSTGNDLLTSPTSTVLGLGLPGAIITSGTTADMKQFINFVHGIDVYNVNGSGTEKRKWIFGDVLHSKPFVMNYASYTFNKANEACPPSGLNKTMIFVGSNDGMVHAINDCDGSEAWAFIPPDILPYLQYNHGPTHTYFVDSTIYPYVYDENKNGTIDLPHDKVILIIGMRRGGGIFSSEPTTGYYYALDVSDPASPTLLWSISNNKVRKGNAIWTSTDYANLGETWSEPKIGRISEGSPAAKDKIVIFIGGGYDNCYEDSRYGATQKFSGYCVSTIATNDGGLDATSASTTVVGDLAQYKGRAVYVVELATLNSGVPDFTNGGSLVHAFTTAEYAMLSEMTALDTNFDGYADRLYMGDTGGNLWRFDISSTTASDWKMTKIFSSNPSEGGYTNGTADGTTGRKIFYKPSAVVDAGNIVRLYFGTGDREHPLNRAVYDRMYEVIDKGQASAVTEAKLVDVTEDQLQTTTDPTSQAFQDLLANLADTSDPNKTNFYGWYIRLDQNSGEKVLAGATVYNKVVYYSTYSPNTAVVTDPCQAGNLGTARIYVVDYQNGSSVMNFDTSNDSQYTTYKTNSYSTPTSAGGNVLLRSDRLQRLGTGIPSGVVVTGDKVLIGCGGGICTTSTNPGGQILPVYWRQR